MTKKKLITGLAVGAAIGGIIGYLYATESGAKTRQKISDQTGHLVDEFLDYCMNIIQGGKEKAEDIKDTAIASADNLANKFQ
ncbi:MAG: YtxH domain-containing protein [Ferruginibacter sp.]